MTTEEILNNLDFSNDFMFWFIMTEYKDICKKVIETILHIKVKKLEYIEGQKKEKQFMSTKAVIFDIYAEDDKIYEIEMQTSPNKDILKRARFYQAMIDIGQLEPGQSYKELKDTFVIFICTFDPFKEGESKYSVKRSFEYNKGKSAYNGTHEIYLNAKGYEKEKDLALREFLCYISTKETNSELTKEIHTAVNHQKAREEVRNMYLDFNMIQMDARDEARERAREEARQEYQDVIAQERAENARQREYIAREKARNEQKDAYIAQLEKQLHLQRI